MFHMTYRFNCSTDPWLFLTHSKLVWDFLAIPLGLGETLKQQELSTDKMDVGTIFPLGEKKKIIFKAQSTKIN